MGLICDLVLCPGCGHQVPRHKLKGVCDGCVAAQTAHEDHDSGDAAADSDDGADDE